MTSRSLVRITLIILSAIVVAAAAPAAPKKKKKPESAPAKPDTKNQIEFLVTAGANMNDAVLAPLEKNFAHDIRPTLIRLRDNLLDEAKDHPAASRQTYAAGARLVNAWLSALQERETRRASMGLAAPPSADLQHKKKTVLHDWEDVLTFQRELKDAREFRATEKKKKQFFKDADKNSWRLRTEALRPDLEALYSQFRALRREST